MTCNQFLSRAAALLFAGLFASASASASTIYEFTLTPTTGTVGGTVLVTFDNPISSTGSFDANTNAGVDPNTLITSLLVTLSNGEMFTLNNANGAADIGFSNGVLTNFSYYADSSIPVLEIYPTSYQFTSDGYTDPHDPGFSAGTLKFDGVAPVATPEPSSLILLGTGLLGVAGVARRRLAA